MTDAHPSPRTARALQLAMAATDRTARHLELYASLGRSRPAGPVAGLRARAVLGAYARRGTVGRLVPASVRRRAVG